MTEATTTENAEEQKTAPAAPAAAEEKAAAPEKKKDERNHKPFSKGFLKHSLTLTNGRTINVMSGIYRRASVAYYNISVILQIIARDEKSREMVEEAHNFLTTTSENLNATIDERVAELNKLCQENGIATSSWKEDIGFTHAQSWEIKVASPWAKKFLVALQRIDEYIGLLDWLWLNGMIEDRDHVKLPRQIIREILRFASMAIQMEVNAFRYVNSMDNAEVKQEVEESKATEADEPNAELAPETETDKKNLEKWVQSEMESA